MSIYGPPIGTYTNAVACPEAAQDEIIANINVLAGLLGASINATTGAVTLLNTAGHPDFNKMIPGTRVKILNELSAIAVKIEATATA